MVFGQDGGTNWHMKQFADRWSKVGTDAQAPAPEAKTYDEKTSSAGMQACGSSFNTVKPGAASAGADNALSKGMSKLKFWG